jgi:hypothetical protein
MLLTAMSAGPERLTVMLPESPGPNKMTVCVEPCDRVVPVFAADIPIPMLSAFGGVVEAGATTEIFTPDAF